MSLRVKTETGGARVKEEVLKLPLIENWFIVMVKYGCNRVIFITIPLNNNYVTLVKSGSK
jgi:hypothetical protein